MRKNEIIAILRQTELNIKFYIENDMDLHALNEIGVMRGLLYSLYGYKTPELTEQELSYIELQNKVTSIDKEEQIWLEEK